jgi:multidrug efflux pump subunit AcrA (membrane-fusion protein)
LRRIFWWAVGVAGALALAVVAVLAATHHHGHIAHAGVPGIGSEESDDDPADEGCIPVRTIRPKYDPSFVLSVREPATVEPYYVAELDAQVAGRVELIRKAEGSPVKAGEVLAKLAVPDLDQEVAQKDAVVQQRRDELEVARAGVKIAEAARLAAGHNIEVKKAEIDVAESNHTYYASLVRRLDRLKGSGVNEEVLEENKQRLRAAEADVTRAKNAVLKAKADLTEAEAKLDAAKADIRLKESLVRVAQKDRDKAQALADYSQVRSAFDGQIKRRHVDPGSYVRVGDPVLTVERTDIVTVTMKVPDTYAPYVSSDTEAVVEMSELPGQVIHGKVTRFPRSLINKENDHTMLVEVDLFNGTEKEYQDFLARERAKATPFDDLQDGPLPIFPEFKGKGAARPARRLIPGMYGEMRLVFRKLPNAYLLPSDAVGREGGTPYIYVVRDGKARRLPVAVEVDDQRLAKVAVLEHAGNDDVERPLTGDEEVIHSNLPQLSDGQPVKPMRTEWKVRN